MALSSDHSWILAAAYFVVAGTALFASRVGSRPLERTFWGAAGFALVAFGLAKQFRLQGQVTNWIRTEARVFHLYDQRKFVEYPFLVVVASAALFAAVRLRDRSARCSAATATAGLASLLLTAFLLIRAASLHAIDPLMYKPMLGLRSGWWAELAFLLVIAVAAVLSSRARDPG